MKKVRREHFNRWLELSLGDQSIYQTVVLAKYKSLKPSIRLLVGMTVYLSILIQGIAIQRAFSIPYDFLPLVVAASMFFGIILAWLCLGWELITKDKPSITLLPDQK